jgi:hypothetical protein
MVPQYQSLSSFYLILSYDVAYHSTLASDVPSEYCGIKGGNHLISLHTTLDYLIRQYDNPVVWVPTYIVAKGGITIHITTLGVDTVVCKKVIANVN